MIDEYQEKGYFVVRKLFQDKELQELRSILLEFHDSWKHANAEFYAEKAINSAYITGTEHLEAQKRELLFRFLASSKLMNTVTSTLKNRPTFMNTQLFFNPVKPTQKNYWHRDPQYHLSIEQQKQALKGPEVIHFRIPLVDEPGLELIPGSHKRWDTNEELDVRLENKGRKNHEDLSTGVCIKLQAGDLLVFSANMIHRGLYGMDRMALDILFSDPEPSLIKFVSDDCLPSQEIIKNLENPDAFQSTIELKTKHQNVPTKVLE